MYCLLDDSEGVHRSVGSIASFGVVVKKIFTEGVLVLMSIGQRWPFTVFSEVATIFASELLCELTIIPISTTDPHAYIQILTLPIVFVLLNDGTPQRFPLRQRRLVMHSPLSVTLSHTQTTAASPEIAPSIRSHQQ